MAFRVGGAYPVMVTQRADTCGQHRQVSTVVSARTVCALPPGLSPGPANMCQAWARTFLADAGLLSGAAAGRVDLAGGEVGASTECSRTIQGGDWATSRREMWL